MNASGGPTRGSSRFPRIAPLRLLLVVTGALRRIVVGQVRDALVRERGCALEILRQPLMNVEVIFRDSVERRSQLEQQLQDVLGIHRRRIPKRASRAILKKGRGSCYRFSMLKTLLRKAA